MQVDHCVRVAFVAQKMGWEEYIEAIVIHKKIKEK
jgi:preprotein translocase subunit Sss1